jgi:ketosteroid isomerase-like protein
LKFFRGSHGLTRASALLIIMGFFASALMAGCAKERKAEVAELKLAIEAANARFADAFSRRDVAAIGQLYTPDAEAYPPGIAPVSGRGAIQDMWKGLLSMPVGRIQLTTVEVDGNGETAWETGRYSLLGNNGSTMDEGKYIVIWKRDPDGWKLHRDMWSSNTPQGTPSTVPPAGGN